MAIPGGGALPGPDPAVKRRHLLLHGAPSCGKSLWLSRTFGRRQVYHVPKSGHQFDSFFAQPVIIFDDAEPFPSKGLLTTLTECCEFVRYVPARYYNRVLPAGWCGVVVIVCNTEDIPVIGGVSLLDHSWFSDRFIVRQIVQGDIPLPIDDVMDQ